MSSAELERGEGNPVYAALLVDVKNSKEYDNGRRMALQERIDDAIRLLNDLCEESLVKKVGFSGGDEIQGLFHDPVSAYLYYRLFSLTLGVGTFRCGIGVGAWDVRLEGREESAAQDGEAYHLAREAIGEAARSDYYDLVCCGSEPNRGAFTILLDHSWGICKMRTVPQNELALIAELYYPLMLEGRRGSRFVERCYRDTPYLLETYARGLDKRKRETSIVAKLLSGGSFERLDMEPVSAWRLNDGIGGRVDTLVGAAGEIAAVAGVSRQGLGRKISQGRLFQERRAIALLERFFQQVWR